MKTFKGSTSDDVFAFLEDKILEIDNLLGRHEYMIIGSYVRDIHLNRAGLKSPRGTQDLDVSVAVQDFPDFREKLDAFGSQRGVLTRRYLGGTPIDIIPFGPIARDGSFSHGDSRWELRGLAEAYKTAELLEIGDASVKIPRLQAMMGLKIIAWGERLLPTDCSDFRHLLRASTNLSLNQEKGSIWDSDVWENEDIIELCEGDPVLLAAYEAGQKLAGLFWGEALEQCLEVLADESEQEDFAMSALRDIKEEESRKTYKDAQKVFLRGMQS